jgi:L-threonylcarbamoyladenylate synthase
VDDLLILDGGPCTVGLESTVLDVTTDPPRILRPGMVTEAMVTEVFGYSSGEPETQQIARSPGQMPRHYAPKVPLLVVSTNRLSEELASRDGVIMYSYNPGLKTNTVHNAHLERSRSGKPSLWIKQVFLSPEVDDYASNLYAALHDLEEAEVKRIIVEKPPLAPEWTAVHDRLRRAATPKAE